MASSDLQRIAKRAVDPAAQHAAAHGGHRAVHDAAQGVLTLTAETLIKLQVAAGRGIDDDRILTALDRQAAEVGQAASLGVHDVLKQTARSRHCQG